MFNTIKTKTTFSLLLFLFSFILIGSVIPVFASTIQSSATITCKSSESRGVNGICITPKPIKSITKPKIAPKPTFKPLPTVKPTSKPSPIVTPTPTSVPITLETSLDLRAGGSFLVYAYNKNNKPIGGLKIKYKDPSGVTKYLYTDSKYGEAGLMNTKAGTSIITPETSLPLLNKKVMGNSYAYTVKYTFNTDVTSIPTPTPTLKPQPTVTPTPTLRPLPTVTPTPTTIPIPLETSLYFRAGGSFVLYAYDKNNQPIGGMKIRYVAPDGESVYSYTDYKYGEAGLMNTQAGTSIITPETSLPLLNKIVTGDPYAYYIKYIFNTDIKLTPTPTL